VGLPSLRGLNFALSTEGHEWPLSSSFSPLSFDSQPLFSLPDFLKWRISRIMEVAPLPLWSHPSDLSPWRDSSFLLRGCVRSPYCASLLRRFSAVAGFGRVHPRTTVTTDLKEASAENLSEPLLQNEDPLSSEIGETRSSPFCNLL